MMADVRSTHVDALAVQICEGIEERGPDRNRTDDLRHAMATLYQLSYGPVKTMLAATPTTSGRRSR